MYCSKNNVPIVNTVRFEVNEQKNNNKQAIIVVRWRISKKGHILSPERALHTSPGQRPGELLKKILSPVRALHK